ncbi:MAG: hypothetical protein EU541_01265 [Promethearchaeota archaeon]|nr:MAG: hypothetical protein EU541_01265 [Candidatus Lokiarchaeota archaeon]
MSQEKEDLRKLIMLISELRAKDEERYSSHVKFMNEVIQMVKAIESQINKHWESVLKSLEGLKQEMDENMDSLLTGINPEGLRETSESLQTIMDTMNKSIQSLNLEKILKDTMQLSQGKVVIQPSTEQKQPEQIQTNLQQPTEASSPQQAQTQGSSTEQGEEWVDPTEKKEEEEEEPHLLKPSDFFK